MFYRNFQNTNLFNKKLFEQASNLGANLNTDIRNVVLAPRFVINKSLQQNQFHLTLHSYDSQSKFKKKKKTFNGILFEQKYQTI